MNDKSLKIDSLRRQIESDDVCSHLRETATQLVMGDGNPDADILFIGEAPGKNEDEQGRPFVGAAGKFLDEMLAAASMKRADVYITNIVKYRPPENRDPTPEEKRDFWPFLLRQIAIIQPRVIITLGRHSGAAFIPDLVISRDHGRPRTVRYHEQSYTLIPLYHPAAALYNGSMRPVLIEDFLHAADIARQA